MKNNHPALAVRTFLALCIVWSLCMMYYVYIVQKNYQIFNNPDGKPTNTN